MTATVGGAVPTPPNNTTTFLRGDGTFAVPSGSAPSDAAYGVGWDGVTTVAPSKNRFMIKLKRRFLRDGSKKLRVALIWILMEFLVLV